MHRHKVETVVEIVPMIGLWPVDKDAFVRFTDTKFGEGSANGTQLDPGIYEQIPADTKKVACEGCGKHCYIGEPSLKMYKDAWPKPLLMCIPCTMVAAEELNKRGHAFSMMGTTGQW